jgi:hypothetical protein
MIGFNRLCYIFETELYFSIVSNIILIIQHAKIGLWNQLLSGLLSVYKT